MMLIMAILDSSDDVKLFVRCCKQQQRWRLGAEFGGTEKNFADQNFWMTSFRKKFQISGWKFLMTFFSHRPYLLCFPCLYRVMICLFTVSNLIYTIYAPFFMRKTSILQKNSFLTPFLLNTYFHTHPITLLLQILGGRIHGPSPPQILGGPSPSPPKSPPKSRIFVIQPF